MSTDDAFSDDDEFGDFEETQQTSTNIDITTPSSSREAFTSLDLFQLIDDAAVFDISESTTPSIDSDIDQTEDRRDYRIFERFVVPSSSGDMSMSIARPAELWVQLRIGESVNALRFQWTTSRSSACLVDALPLQQLSERSNVEYNTLDVNTAGAELEYDYTSFNLGIDDADKSPERAPAAFVERELDSLGLNDINSAQQSPNTAMPALNGSAYKPPSLPHAASSSLSSPHSSSCAPRYLSACELNVEAQNFYAQLPDLSFMLANRVVQKR